MKLAELHRDLRANYSTQWDPDKDLLCKSVLQEMVTKCGAGRTAIAVHDCMIQKKFFSVEELWSCMPAAIVEHRRCPECQTTEGFRYFAREGKSPVVERCKHEARL